jgi:hypothetical protein
MIPSVCRRTRQMLLDEAGSPDRLGPDGKAHLAVCPDCSAFFSVLSGLSSDSHVDIGADYQAIQGAFLKAERIRSKRRGIVSFIIFAFTSAVFIGGLMMLAAAGFAVVLLLFQASMLLACPVALFFIVRARLKGGRYCER